MQAVVDRKAAAMEPAVKARDGRDVRIAAVLERGFARPMGFDEAYVAATYSFEKATRDDVKATNNDWDFMFESKLRVKMVTDDRSRIWDLGAASYADARAGAVTFVSDGEQADVVAGHLYAVHTADSGTDQWALMRVEELVSSESMIFSWAVVEEPRRTAGDARIRGRNDAVRRGPAADSQGDYVEETRAGYSSIDPPTPMSLRSPKLRSIFRSR